MLQPFEPLREVDVMRLQALEKCYLVTQSYLRADGHFTGLPKTNLLCTDYGDPGLAKIHFNAVRHDKFAALINLSNAAHLVKLKSMLLHDSPYRMFWAVVRSARDLQEMVNRNYKDHMRKYIDTKTNWSIGRDQKIRPTVQLTFGELFILLKHGSQTLRIKFEEIESI